MTWTDPRLANWPDGDLDAKCTATTPDKPVHHCMRIGGPTRDGGYWDGVHEAHHWDAPVYGGEVHCPGSVRVPLAGGRPGQTHVVRRDRVPA